MRTVLFVLLLLHCSWAETTEDPEEISNATITSTPTPTPTLIPTLTQTYDNSSEDEFCSELYCNGVGSCDWTIRYEQQLHFPVFRCLCFDGFVGDNCQYVYGKFPAVAILVVVCIFGFSWILAYASNMFMCGDGNDVSYEYYQAAAAAYAQNQANIMAAQGQVHTGASSTAPRGTAGVPNTNNPQWTASPQYGSPPYTSPTGRGGASPW
eukprot:TRINITY_DN58634_c0_g1_i1.p1 TRINITY_DN58634_c0_g1~~TRINITY_DN58634_c0_g1_i1.p1  ORF type:complete len:209 (-),score=22.26 TRINITY_DN58634_c0_g1_i1:247-873(-)